MRAPEASALLDAASSRDVSRSVASTARPTAAEICMETLTMPDAMPASAIGTLAIAIESNGMNDAPAPMPRIANAMKTRGK